MTATRSLWVSRAFPLLVLVVPMLAIGAVTLSVGSVLLDSVVTVMFINLVMVLALQIFMGQFGCGLIRTRGVHDDRRVRLDFVHHEPGAKGARYSGDAPKRGG
jgi:hypothetical protein